MALLALGSAAVHLVFLALVIRGVPPPRMPVLDDAQRAIRVTLLPRSRRPAPSPSVARQPSPRPPRPAHLPPAVRALPMSAPPAIPVAPQPAPAARPPETGSASPAPGRADRAWARLGRAILGHTGCADPDAAGLNAVERAACQDRVAQGLARAKPLSLGISPRKQAEFDRIESCQEKYDRGTMPAGTDESQGSSIHGLGYIPKAHECPPLSH